MYTLVVLHPLYINVRSYRRDNPEKLATQDEDRQNKYTTQYVRHDYAILHSNNSLQIKTNSLSYQCKHDHVLSNKISLNQILY